MRDADGNPFPGMDPYLESGHVWADFHARFIIYFAAAITDQLPPEYVVAVGEHVSSLGPDASDQDVIPDVTVVGPAVPRPARGPAGGAVAAEVGVAAPERQQATLRNRRRADPDVQTYIEVLRLPDRQPVTVIEVLSPKNKRGDGRAVYLDKRHALLDTAASVVELDLLRGGRRIDLADPLPPADHYVYVSRGDRRPLCDVYAWTVRDPLPAVPVPLLPADGELRVGLAGPFAETYKRGRFRRRVRHAEPPPSPPAWAADDLTWVSAVLARVPPPTT